MKALTNPQKIHYTLRIAAAMCFIGHGAFGIITKPIWCNYFALFGIDNWDAWRRIKEKFFGYHRDLLPEDIARRLGGTIAYHKEMNGQWIAVIEVEREQDAGVRTRPGPY